MLYPKVASFAKPEPEERTDGLRLDAPPPPADGDVGAVIKAIQKAANSALSDSSGDIEKAARIASERTKKHSETEFRRIGINLKKEPPLKWLINGWTKDIAGRIKGTTDEQIDKIAKILDEGVGMRAETLAKEIERQVEDVSASRAEQIARSSVLQLNGQITKERQTAAGIDRYIWSASNDERTRESHELLDGTVLSWDGPGDPEEGHPGESPNCRCVAFPILDEIAEAGQEEEDG